MFCTDIFFMHGLCIMRVSSFPRRYVNGDDIVTYKAGGREFDANHMQAMASAPTVGNTVSWGGTIANDRSYAIRVVVDPSMSSFLLTINFSIGLILLLCYLSCLRA